MNYLNRNCPQGSFRYTIRRGDTIFDIAKGYGLTVSDIMAYNRNITPRDLRVGQEICVPFPQYRKRNQENMPMMPNANMPEMNMQNEPMMPNRNMPEMDIPERPKDLIAEGFNYTLKKGDTLFDIARKNNILLERLLEMNPNLNPNQYREGQNIFIPNKRDCMTGSNSYTVGPNETIIDIMKKFDLTYRTIATYNSDVDLENLRPGQMLCISDVRGPGRVCPDGSYAYIIQDGDTVETIARKFDLKVIDILQLNPDFRPQLYRVGGTICLPLYKKDDLI